MTEANKQTESKQILYYFKNSLGDLVSSNIFTKVFNEKRIKRIVDKRHGQRVSDSTSFEFKFVN